MLTEKLDALVAYHNVWLCAAGHPLADSNKMRDELLAMRDELLRYVGQSWRCLADARSASKRVLFEEHKASCLILIMVLTFRNLW